MSKKFDASKQTRTLDGWLQMPKKHKPNGYDSKPTAHSPAAPSASSGYKASAASTAAACSSSSSSSSAVAAPQCTSPGNSLSPQSPAQSHSLLPKHSNSLFPKPPVPSVARPSPKAAGDKRQGGYSCPVGKGYEMWDDFHVKLPCSSKNVNYTRSGAVSGPKWSLIVQQMRRPIANTRELEDVLYQINPAYRGKWEFNGLRGFLEGLANPTELRDFFTTTLPYLQRLVLKTPELFPEPIRLLSAGRGGDVVLTQLQVACLVANAFFCTYPRRNQKGKTGEYSRYPSINFVDLFKTQTSSALERSTCSRSQEGKLRCLLHYLHIQATSQPHQKVLYRRVVTPSPNWVDSQKRLCNLRCHVKGCIEDADYRSVHVDFANKFIGGGIVGRGCVQEEILFALCPELIASRLFTEHLGDQEAMIFVGARRYSQYRGYSATFQYTAPYDETAPVDSNGFHEKMVVAIDAKDFSEPGLTSGDQYHMDCIAREMGKAHGGLKAARDLQKRSVVATGHWGCGAFKGDRELKAIIQLMAASEAGYESIDYFTFGDEPLADQLQRVHKLFRNADIRVGRLYNMLTEVYFAQNVEDPPFSVLQYLHEYVQGWACPVNTKGQSM
uniref:poly(ADP-ribose) glycohydrolase n=1 Tax=Eutreptiella gymnastica TaxID=73025 RepID=A0A7S4CEL3_9EUGL